jgi:adenylate cyclase
MQSSRPLITFIRYYRVIPITILSLILGLSFSIVINFNHLSAVEGMIPSLFFGTTDALMIGYTVIAFEFLVLNRVMRKLTPLWLLLIRIVAYSIFAVFWLSVMYVIVYGVINNLPPEEIRKKFVENGRIQIVSSGAVLMTIIGIFFYQISMLHSRNELVQYLLGRYSKPQRRKKIFMFLDLTASTTHAERLGDLKFSSLLQDCFFDLAKPVYETDGDVYQYIGDEAVVEWEYRDAKNNFGCLRCFLQFRNVLNERREFYLEKYGFVPEFKAGIHGGEVVVVRVGEIKKEIAYHGDVLNTTSRLESLCNQLETKLVISGRLLADIDLEFPLTFEQMPSVPLKGKEQQVEIYRWVEA